MVATILLLCMTMSSAVPAKADLFPENFNKAFSVDVYSTETNKVFQGEFLRYENNLYISEQTVKNITAVEMIHRAEGGLMVIREDTNAKVVFTNEQMVAEGDMVYWPYQETMTMLCLNTWYDEERKTLRVMPTKGIWELPNDFGLVSEYGIYRMESFRNPDAGWYSELLDYKTARAVSMVADVGKNWMKWPKYVTQYTVYEQYRDAVWRIMVPELDESLESISIATGVADLVKFFGQLPEAAIDSINTVATNKGWESLTYGKDAYKKAMGGAETIGNVMGILSDIKNALQIEDMQEYWTVLATMENVNSGLANGLSLILPEAKEQSDALGLALEETVQLMSGDKSPYALMFREVAQGTYDLLIDKALGWTIFEVGTTAANFIADGTLGTQKQIDATLVCTTNLLIQDAAQDAFDKYWKQCDKQSDYKEKAKSIEKMRDCLLVYMMAGYNAWKAMEFDEDLGPTATAIAEAMDSRILELMSYDEFDFSVAKNAENSIWKLNGLVFNDFVEVSVSWKSEVRNTPVELEVLVNGTNSAGKAITLFENGQYYPFAYDSSTGQFTNTSVLTALTRTEFSNSVYLFVIDREGDYEITIRFPEGWNNSAVSLWDCDVILYANWQEQNVHRYIQYDDNGQPYFRVPIEAEWLAK